MSVEMGEGLFQGLQGLHVMLMAHEFSFHIISLQRKFCSVRGIGLQPSEYCRSILLLPRLTVLRFFVDGLRCV